jgi:hypothetical protein
MAPDMFLRASSSDSEANGTSQPLLVPSTNKLVYEEEGLLWQVRCMMKRVCQSEKRESAESMRVCVRA